MLPRIRLTDLLEEVDRWTGFIELFEHAGTGRPPAEKRVFLATFIAEATNLGLARLGSFAAEPLCGRPKDASVMWAMAECIIHDVQLFFVAGEGPVGRALVSGLFWCGCGRWP